MSASMPPVRMIQANGIRLAVYEARGGDGRLPPLVLCHGFPELAFSWRHQIAGLAAAGFHVLAPDMRGYGASSAPERVEAYALDQLVGDVVGLLDACGIAKAVLVGHDWGGFVVWAAAQRAPERVAGVVALNTRHSARAPADPIAIFRKRFGAAHYIVAFQEEGRAEAVLDADPERVFRLMTQTPLPDAAPSVEAFALLEAAAQADPAALRPSVFTEAELAVYVDTFRRTGFRGGVNWYRNISRNWERSAGLADTITQPALMIYTDRDPTCTPASLEGMERLVPDLEKRLIENCGHWTMQQHPSRVTEFVADWVKRRFSSSP